MFATLSTEGWGPGKKIVSPGGGSRNGTPMPLIDSNLPESHYRAKKSLFPFHNFPPRIGWISGGHSRLFHYGYFLRNIRIIVGSILVVFFFFFDKKIIIVELKI